MEKFYVYIFRNLGSYSIYQSPFVQEFKISSFITLD